MKATAKPGHWRRRVEIRKTITVAIPEDGKGGIELERLHELMRSARVQRYLTRLLREVGAEFRHSRTNTRSTGLYVPPAPKGKKQPKPHATTRKCQWTPCGQPAMWLCQCKERSALCEKHRREGLSFWGVKHYEKLKAVSP